ncbi:MAG: ZIP family metal transporter [Thermoplasmata archaeon]
MGNFAVFLALTIVMGLSIFLSLPLVYSRRAQGRWAVALNAGAIGILIFLLADIFADVAPILYPHGYVADLGLSILFAVAFTAAFLLLFGIEALPRGRGAEGGPQRTAFMIALAIGLQNLTEGLVFGVNWSAGNVGVLAVVFVGFFLQNVTEGFPIAAPFLGTGARRGLPMMAGLFLVGGLPTVLGGVLGYHWSSNLFLVGFDALAIGSIAYVILPMLRIAFRPLESKEAAVRRNRIVYLGVMIGFLVGFLVNAL